MRLLSLALLFTACASAGRPSTFKVTPVMREAVVRDTLATLDTYYVFPERLPALVAQLRARWTSDAFRRIDDAHALVDRMNADFRDVFHDGHLRILLAAAVPKDMLGDPEVPPTAAELEDQRRHHFGIGEAKVREDGIGYLRLRAFPSPSELERKAYADAMAKVASSRALIIDLRENGGGDGDSVADLVGYFLPDHTLLQYDVERGGKKREHRSTQPAGPAYGADRPVYVLVSRHTFSAAEECAYDLQTQKRATIVGEPTGGGAHHNRFEAIADGAFVLSVPYMTTVNPVTQTNWEGKGVQPDVAASAGDALQVAMKLALSRAGATTAQSAR